MTSLIKNAMAHGSGIEQIIGMFEMGNAVIMEFARQQFGLVPLLEQSRPRLEARTAFASVIITDLPPARQNG